MTQKAKILRTCYKCNGTGSYIKGESSIDPCNVCGGEMWLEMPIKVDLTKFGIAFDAVHARLDEIEAKIDAM